MTISCLALNALVGVLPGVADDSRGGVVTPSVFGNGVWNDAAVWNDAHIWKDAP